MNVPDLLDLLQQNALAMAISSGVPWKHLFAAIETVHVLALTFTVGTIVMVDLRLLGVTSRDSAISKISREVLPLTWGGFVIALISGSLLFISKAPTYFHTLQFQLKFLCMFLAFLNMLTFHFGIYRRVVEWDTELPPPMAARIAGGLSLSLWFAVIVFGRWVGFTGFSGFPG
jgi:hypothetical protein